MCGRYVLASKITTIEKRFGVTSDLIDDLKANLNISVGQATPVISSENPSQLQMFTFGFCPTWAKKRFYVINARSEGDSNKENDPLFKGAKGIVRKPFFKKSIRTQRCLVIADAFIEGPQKEKLSKPYVVYLKDKQRPFAFAGLYDYWTNPETGEIHKTFAIITTTANKVLQKLGHHRSPVILKKEDERKWIDPNLPLDTVTSLLETYDWEEMNAYPIGAEIKNPKANYTELLDPIGERLFPESDYYIDQKLNLEGMGMSQARKPKN